MFVRKELIVVYSHKQLCMKSQKKRKFCQEIFIMDVEKFECYLILIEFDDDDLPIRTFILDLPKLDERFKIYPYLKN